MAFIYKWIEGAENLEKYCNERFGESPQICEHHGYCNAAKIFKTEKEKPDGSYGLFFLLYMQSDNGTVYNMNDIKRMNYGQIRADKSSILKR